MEQGDFFVTQYDIQVKKLNEPIYLVPFGDLHFGSPLFHKDKWAEFLEWAADKPRVFFLGMGDYFDMSSTSERKLLLSPELHESTIETLEEWYDKQVTALWKDIKFMGGKLVGLLEGNHYSVYNNNMTTTQRLAQLAKCKYLGWSAFVRLNFRRNGSNTSSCIDVFAHHGTGAARKHGGSLLGVEKMMDVAEADIYLAGHDHRKTASLANRLRLAIGGPAAIRLSHRKILLGRTGSFLRGYVPDKKSYVARRNLPPTDLGVLKIELTPRRLRGERDIFYIDIHASI